MKRHFCNCPHPVESSDPHRRCSCGARMHEREVVCRECGKKHNCGTCGYHDWIRSRKV